MVPTPPPNVDGSLLGLTFLSTGLKFTVSYDRLRRLGRNSRKRSNSYITSHGSTMTLLGFSVKAASEESGAFRINVVSMQVAEDFAAELF
jgi:hypothetical protein